MWPRSAYYAWKSRGLLRADRGSLEEFQRQQIREIIESAAQKDLYSEIWPERSRQLDKLPVVDREQFRQKEQGLSQLSTGKAVTRETSGSTGDPAKVKFSEKAHDWLSAIHLRTMYLQGVRPFQETVQYWEGMQDQRSLPGRALMPKTYIEPGTPPEIQAEMLEEKDPDVIQYFPHQLLKIAKIVEREEYDLEPELVVTYGETVSPGMKNYISRVLGADVRDQYATTEFGTLAWECPEGGYHLNEDVVYPEVLDNEGEEVAAGETGRLVLTGLVNEATPLVRYSIGDMVEKGRDSCSCDTSFQRIARFRGREDRVILNSRGEKIYPDEVIDRVAPFSGFLEYQLVAEEESYTLEYTVVEDEAPDREQVARQLGEQLSLEPLELKAVEEIEKRSGKLQVIENHQDNPGKGI